jgi:hypothetical protein
MTKFNFATFVQKVNAAIIENCIKKITTSLLLILFCSAADAQYITSYTAARTSVTYAAISAGTQLCSGAACADQVYTVALPWSFTFNGVSYSTIYISQNGFISFGSAATGTVYTPISTAGTSGIISAWGYNNNVTAASHIVRHKNNGTSYSIEWVRSGTGTAFGGTHLDAQITLFQTTNVIEFTYRAPASYPVIGSLNAQVGLRGALNTEFKNLTTISAAVAYGGANTSTAGYSGTNYTAVNNTKITWTPPSFCTPPSTQATSLNYTGLSTSSVIVNWTSGNGAARVVVARQTSAVSVSPTNGTDYTATANSVFASGANLGSNNYVVYQGTGNSVNVTGLTAGQTYHFAVFEYVTSPSICYLSPGLAGSQAIPTCFPASIAASSIGFSNVLTTSNDVTWVRGNGDGGVIVVARLTSTASVAPVSGTTYTTTTFGSGAGNQLTGAGNYIVYVGTGTSVNVANLLPSTNYTYSVYEYMTAGICFGSAGAANQTTASCSPSSDASAAVFSNVLGTTLTLQFTRGSGSNVLVVARATATPNIVPSYNNSYAANVNFGSGATTGTGNFVVFNGTGNSVNVTGLAEATSYTFSVYEYNASPNCYSITPLTSTITTLNTTASGLAMSCAYTGSSQSLTLATITATAGRVLVATGASIDDGNYPNQDIQSMTGGSGFLFNYLGTDYSSFGLNANGFIWFGAGQPASSYASYGGTPVGSASANLGGSGIINGIIAAAGADLISHYHLSAAPATAQINVVVTGTAPNRIVTIEWTGFQAKSLTNNSTCWQIGYTDDSRLDFQIRLYEKGGANSNRVEMVYRTQGPYCVFDSYSFQVGMRGASNADFATRANAGSMTSSSTTNGGTSSTVISLSSSTFINGNVGVRYQPNLSVPTITGTLTNTCPAVGTTLTSSSVSNNQWFLNGSVIPGPGSSSQTYTATQSGSYSVTVNASGCYGQSAPSVVSITPCDVIITASSGINGTISPIGNVAVPYGNSQLFTFTPVCGYAVSDVLVDGASQGSIPNYTFTNVTLPHTVSVTYAVASESCNGIDDNCDGFIDEGCTPNFYGDTPGTAPSVVYSSNAAYPNCYPIAGDNTNAGDSPESIFTGPDSWYAFVAQSNGITITMSGSSMDNALALYSKTGSNYILLDAENINPAGIGGFERLTNSTLTPGTTYYVTAGAASGNIGGPYSICIQHLMPSGCAYTIPVGGFALCDNYKATYRGASGNGVTYNFNFTGIGGGASGTTFLNGTNGLISLANSSLALRYGGIYNVTVDVIYSLQNGAGVYENITILGNVLSANCSSVSIIQQPQIEVKLSQRCPATLLRSNYLIGTAVSGNQNACAAINFTYEFRQIIACNDTTPVSAFPLIFTTNSNTPYLQMGNLPNLSNQGAWSVRIRPNFSYGAGTYGPKQIVTVNNTSASAMLPADLLQENELKSSKTEMSAALYPNPNHGALVNLNLTDLTSGQIQIRIIDALGRVVHTRSFSTEGSLNTILSFDQPLGAGIYFVEFLSNGESHSERMIVD